MTPKDDAEILFQGRFLRFLEFETWEYVERERLSPGVIVAALTPQGELLLVEQYRPPMRGRVLELPAGLAADSDEFEGESAIDAARRELIEETGWEATEVEEVARGPISPGLSNEIIVVTRARGLRRVGPGGGEPEEDITVHQVPLDELDRWLDARRAQGIHVDPKVLLAPGLLRGWAQSTDGNDS